MNKNLLFAIGLIVATALGYFIRGNGGKDLVYDYADCIRDCVDAHDAKVATINHTYEICFDAALDEFRRSINECPCSNPIKPPCIVCRDRAFEVFSTKIAPCRATRDTALAAENETYNDCRAKCNNRISVLQK